MEGVAAVGTGKMTSIGSSAMKKCDEFKVPHRCRSLTLDDLQACFELEKSAHTHPWSKAQMLSALQRYHCQGIEIDGQLVAFAIFSSVAGEAELLDFVVSPTHQGNGLGSKLFGCLASYLQERADIQCLYLEVRESNAAAQAVYRNAGMAEVGVRQGYYPSVNGREDAIIMAMELI